MFAVGLRPLIKCNKCNEKCIKYLSVTKGLGDVYTFIHLYTYFLKKVYTQKIMTETLYV